MPQFVHLHVHTQYSILDGQASIQRLVDKAMADGQPGIAVTDHGDMFGIKEFYNYVQKVKGKCKDKAAEAEARIAALRDGTETCADPASEIAKCEKQLEECRRKLAFKPIIGCEVYVAPRTRLDKVHELDDHPYHPILLCRNEVGYRNLSALVSRGFTEGFYSKPRVDWELLERYHEGLIALSACLAGQVPRLLLGGNYEGAKAHALQMRDLFGADSYYLEIQDHSIPQQKTVLQGLLRLHQETGIPLVATNDAHYLTREDASIQDVLMCIQMGKTVEDPHRMRFETQEFYLKSEAEMAALFPNYPEALENTVKIAQLCNVEFEFGKYHLPHFQLPEGWTDGDAYFEKLCMDGFRWRYPSQPQEYLDKLRYEMDMIRKMGFVDYFLIVSDFIAYAKGHGIPVGPGRGSAAGSMVSYCLNITDLDPVKYSLYFERFLNPERVTMPDIDIDFCIRRRQEVIDYVAQKYGADHVAQIVTFGTMAARAAVRDVGRVLNMPYADVDVIAKQIPSGPGALHITLEDALKLSKQLKESYDGSPQVKKLIDTARAIEGMPRNTSTHAAGVVITSRPVSDYVPLAKNDDLVVTQYIMTTLEELGLLKMDFLGLRNLTVLDDAARLVRRSHPDFHTSQIPEDDPATFQMLSEGRTSGVFQMESAGMTGVCIGLKPQSIEDITAIIALYRPGPMESIPRFIACKHNPEKVTYKHPALVPILSNTYGCIVYQEQVIQIFQQLGGYSLGQADMVRRAMSKKKVKDIERERETFLHGDPARSIAGCAANGIPEAVAQSIYDEIYDFANYAFNKAHAVCYAVVAYQTAWFKCHHPKEYMAALLTSVLDSSDKVAEYIAECKEWHISLLPPDINESEADFTVSEGGIRFGLVALKGVGRSVINSLLEERSKGGPFTDFMDFCDRMFDHDLNRRVLESLIKSGAFDRMGCKRSQLMEVFGQVLDGIAASRKRNVEGQMDLFGMGGGEAEQAALPALHLANIPEYTPQQLMTMEKETTGIYISGHPMDDYRPYLRNTHVVHIGSLMEEDNGFQDDQIISVAGIVQTVKMKTTRNNSMMAYVTVEDDTASIEMLAFSNVLDQYGGYLRENSAVVITGRLSLRDDKEPQIVINRARPISDYADGSAPPEQPQNVNKSGTLYLRLPGEEGMLYPKTRCILNMFPGESKAVLFFADTGRRRGTQCCIRESMLSELKNVLGEANVVLK